MLRLIGAAVVAAVLLLVLGDAVGLAEQRDWFVRGLQDLVADL